MQPKEQHPSKTQVDKAGETLRAYIRDEGVRFNDALAARNIARAWRQEHTRPLALVTPGVRNWVSQVTSLDKPDVGQRLKRLPAIMDKLIRFPEMRLSQMEDIGGCRAVLANPSEVEAVASRIQRKWKIRGTSDYRESGKPVTGYRALHYMVVRESRLIEVQLRTVMQHAWAERVERLASRVGYNLKGGEGPGDLIEYLRVLSDVIWLREGNQPVGPTLERRADELEERIRDQFQLR